MQERLYNPVLGTIVSLRPRSEARLLLAHRPRRAACVCFACAATYEEVWRLREGTRICFLVLCDYS